MTRTKKRQEDIPKGKCVHCGKELEDKNFYKSHGSIYMGNDNCLPICKDCIKILYEQYKIKYTIQFVILNIEPKKHEIEKLAIKRLCMMFDIYYSDRLFEAALKNQEKSPNFGLLPAYFKMINLRQNKNKTYDNTVYEENLSQELVKPSIEDRGRKKFEDYEVYNDIYDLCMELL